ncbi:MAG: CtsR family transcriptional regulator [Selenomonadaceae bacterium]|nr:CtsR family transcriptional regulator [Selenomonadaceae bacterium]
MLNNKADTIEEYILKKLSEEQEGSVELKRTKLADEVSCAPSQISYVLSTRFTHEKGFIVESRRGLGGYIKITIVTDQKAEKKLMYDDMLREIDAKTNFDSIKLMLDYILERGIITRREAEIIAQMCWRLYNSEKEGNISGEERAKLIRSIFATLSKIT